VLTVKSVRVIRIMTLGINMSEESPMTSIRVRRYDVERLKEYALPNEALWETLLRVLNEYTHTRIEG